MTITTINVNIDIQNCEGLEYLNAIPDNTIDLILTDPPYIISRNTGMNKHYNDVKFNLNKLQLSYFHKQNLECAIACCLQLNVSPKLIVKSLKKIQSPPGRSETINLKKISSNVKKFFND